MRVLSPRSGLLEVLGTSLVNCSSSQSSLTRVERSAFFRRLVSACPTLNSSPCLRRLRRGDRGRLRWPGRSCRWPRRSRGALVPSREGALGRVVRRRGTRSVPTEWAEGFRGDSGVKPPCSNASTRSNGIGFSFRIAAPNVLGALVPRHPAARHLAGALAEYAGGSTIRAKNRESRCRCGERDQFRETTKHKKLCGFHVLDGIRR